MSDFADQPPEPSNYGGQALVGTDGHFQHADPSLLRLLGYDLDDLKRLRFHDIPHGDDLLRDEAQFERLLEQGSGAYSILKRYFTPNGRTRMD